MDDVAVQYVARYGGARPCKHREHARHVTTLRSSLNSAQHSPASFQIQKAASQVRYQQQNRAQL